VQQRQDDLRLALGRRGKALREQAGLSLADLAEVAHEVGLVHWDASTVLHIENGRRRLTVEECLILPAVFALATNSKLALVDLLAAETWVDPDGEGLGQNLPRELLTRLLVTGVTPKDLRTSFYSYSEKPGRIEAAVAEQLGVDPGFVAWAAAQRYRRTAREERERRVGDVVDARRRQALRGHATRAIKRELLEYFPSWASRPEIAAGLERIRTAATEAAAERGAFHNGSAEQAAGS
jgi:transcriptional regulator with XRE-family HTH domain